MKLAIFLFNLIFVVSSFRIERNVEQEFALVPDDDGNLHLEELGLDLNMELDPVGCFDPKKDVRFMLYTRNNPDKYQQLKLDDPDSLRNSNFNPNVPTRFYIHGWMSSGDSKMGRPFVDAFLQKGEFNVIMIDWSKGAKTFYFIASSRVESVGKVGAEFISFLNREAGINPLKITVAGLSLGAHVAGHIGKNLPSNLRLGVISALDAANPLFFENIPSGRVHFSDAEYVESIQTNGNFYGIFYPIGDASFYPNYGRQQPGCWLNACSHYRAFEFYIESINSNTHFWGRNCRNLKDIESKNCVANSNPHKMGGESVNVGGRGIYWVPINDKYPYAKGMV